VKRAKRWMLRRNAAVALGNVGDESCVEALARAMRDDEHPVVRGHAAWAFGHLAGRRITTDARRYLFAALPLESDPAVRDEIEAALHASHAPPHGTSVAM
jgi:epoxyqueuosine reductase